MKILALDPATKCGWAYASGDALTASGTWDLSVRRDESAGMRLIRLRSKLNDFLSAGLDLVVFEAARHAAPGMQGALKVQSMIESVVVVWCLDNGIEHRGYSPAEPKKFATGKGNANKDAVIAAVRSRWAPTCDSHDEADAIALLHLAVAEYGS